MDENGFTRVVGCMGSRNFTLWRDPDDENRYLISLDQVGEAVGATWPLHVRGPWWTRHDRGFDMKYYQKRNITPTRRQQAVCYGYWVETRVLIYALYIENLWTQRAWENYSGMFRKMARCIYGVTQRFQLYLAHGHICYKPPPHMVCELRTFLLVLKRLNINMPRGIRYYILNMIVS